MYEIGKHIKSAREMRNLSQKEFAILLGSKSSTVSNWEQGLTRPDADTIALICRTLQVSADDLLGLSVEQMTVTDKERRLILAYRNHPEMHPATDAMYGLNT